MRRPRLFSSLCATSFALLAACSGAPDAEDDFEAADELTSGRWVLPATVREIGANTRVGYDNPPSWSPKSCGGKLRAGANALGEFLEDEFPAISSIGGYACRANTANTKQMSVHGTGRALDIFVPKVNGAANAARGDAIANWLVVNAQDIGVQLVIWNRTLWNGNGKNDRAYTGPNPHTDHLHVELTEDAAAMLTPWFSAAPIDDAPLEPDAGDGDDEGLDPWDGEDDATPAPDAGTPPEPEPDDELDPVPDDAADDDGDDHGEDGAPGTLPSEGDDVPLFDDEPAEGESMGTSQTKRRRRASGASYEDADLDFASAGCSAAPGRTGAAGALPLALALAACMVRRRRSA